MTIFPYGREEIDHLKNRDKKLGRAMDKIGLIERQTTPDLFQALARNIVAQQISGPAARTVYGRLQDKAGELTATALADLKVEEVQQCGMSMRKASYLKDLAEAVRGGRIDLEALQHKPDQEVIQELSSLNGIGVWTAEMLLIFSLHRKDVLSWGDLAIKRGMIRLYGLQELDRARFERYRKRYSPYGTVASLYLWAIAGGELFN